MTLRITHEEACRIVSESVVRTNDHFVAVDIAPPTFARPAPGFDIELATRLVGIAKKYAWNGRIPGIKEVREAVPGLGLYDAKRFVEAVLR